MNPVATEPKSRAHVTAGLCFVRNRQHADPALAYSAAFMQSIRDIDCLPDNIAIALSTLFRFLQCGEESATHAFSDTLAAALSADDSAILKAIAADETKHAWLIEQWTARLPSPTTEFDVRVSQWFFRRLFTQDRALHFARIAALDAEVCRILSGLIRGEALSACAGLRAVLMQLRADEVNHVRVTRAMATKLGMQRDALTATTSDVQQRLRVLLQPARASLALLTVPCALVREPALVSA